MAMALRNIRMAFSARLRSSTAVVAALPPPQFFDTACVLVQPSQSCDTCRQQQLMLTVAVGITARVRRSRLIAE